MRDPLKVLFLLIILMSGCTTRLELAKEYLEPGKWDGNLLVRTRLGLVAGIKDREESLSWKGIPYAQAPVGDLRWKAPRPMLPWEGVFHADLFGNVAAQVLPVIGIFGSEDCLSLNIWRPDTRERDLPVYVFIHGGGNTTGTSQFPEYQGYALSTQANLIYVSINYRLGVFGWFRQPSLVEGESPEDASGNYGTLDIIQALSWIQENIASFGGNPERVTVSGESAGAMNILSLLLSPLAKGLFHGAVLQSGTTSMPTIAEAERSSQEILCQLLIQDGRADDTEDAAMLVDSMKNTEIKNYLRSKKPQDLARALQSRPQHLAMMDYPTIYPDGYVISTSGYQALVEGTYPIDIPLIIGSNKDESTVFMAFGNEADLEPESYRKTARYRSDAWRWRGVDFVTQAISSHSGKAPVYSYRFDWGSPDASGESPLPGNMGTQLGAFHSIEIPFFLGTDSSSTAIVMGNYFTESNRKGRQDLSSTIIAYLKAFAWTGDPNSLIQEELPFWTPRNHDVPSRSTLVFDAHGDKALLSTISDVISAETLRAYALQEFAEPQLSAELRILENNNRLQFQL